MQFRIVYAHVYYVRCCSVDVDFMSNSEGPNFDRKEAWCVQIIVCTPLENLQLREVQLTFLTPTKYRQISRTVHYDREL